MRAGIHQISKHKGKWENDTKKIRSNWMQVFDFINGDDDKTSSEGSDWT